MVLSKIKLMAPVFKVSVFVSGGGSNFQAIMDAAIEGVRIVSVICDRPGARAIDRAKAAGVPVETVDRSLYESRGDFEAEILARLAPCDPDLIVLAGFMRVLSPEFVKRFEGRIVNIHPSLLPAFRGMNAVRQALAAGVAEAGCTIHFVDEGLDTGPVITAARVAVEPGDTEQTLSEKIHKLEHKIYPEVIGKLARGEIRLEGGKVKVS